MKMNNENEIKDLNFGGAEESAPVSSQENTEPTPAPTPAPQGPRKLSDHENGAGGNGNSFYDRQQNTQGETKWYKDWRGKTLGLTLAGLILIGGGIPAGMAMAGYWSNKDFDGLVESSEAVIAYDLANDEVTRIYNEAILERYDSLVDEGYITKKAHDNKLEDSEENANDIIDSEKESLKDEYGNTWEEEWDKSLKDKGFHTSANGGEEEYKDSMIVSDVESDVKDKFNDKSAMTSVADTDTITAQTPDFVSTEETSRHKFYYVENLVPSIEDGDTDWATIGSYSYTPEDLMNLYLLTYEPIVFNNSLLPFVPVLGATQTEANIQGDNVYMTNANVKSAWSFAKAEAAGVPAAENFGGIKSKYNVSFSSESLGEEANIAVNLAMEGTGTTASATTITQLVDAGFATAGMGASTSVTSTQIENMTSSDIELFQEGMGDALKAAGLLTAEGSTRNFATTNVFAGSNTVGFVSTNGLNNIGISFEGSEVVVEQLDFYADVKDAIDLSLISNFNTWFESAFKYITIIDYFTDPVDSADGWFTGGPATRIDLPDSTYTPELAIKTNDKYDEWVSSDNVILDQDDLDAGITNEQVKAYAPLALFQPIVINTLNHNAETYTNGKTFVETNWEDYDATSWETEAGATILDFQSTSNLSQFTDYYLEELVGTAKTTIMKNTKNKVMIEGGKQ